MTIGTGVITGVSISHERASVDEIDAAAVDSQRYGVETLLSTDGIEEAVVLQTCNRTEAFAVATDHEVGLDALTLFTDAVGESATMDLGHEESLRHLMRVASGLESFVLGEDQILGQVRDAYEDARAVGGIGPLLEEAVTKAIHVGERARTETAINEGVVSLASAAVRMAEQERGVEGETALVVGAGEMGRLAAKSLAESVGRVIVANRTIPHAEHIAETVDVDASAIGLESLEDAVDDASIVISATGSPDTVFDADAFADAGETLVLDIAQPRDVPPAADSLAAVTVYDLDDLESVTQQTRRQRRAAAERVEAMIDDEFEHLLTRYKRKRADTVISAMYESAEHIKSRELDTALGKLDDLDDDQQEIVESMADAIVNQLLAAPTRSLRDAAEDDDWTTINTALQLFDPEFGPDDVAIEPAEFVDVGKQENADTVTVAQEQLDD
ncbi:glutamyl-tRNA reductase [Haloarculaceae archaeon H-GB2-1]|nr:glutamyl-tRNA reductase [Haloarculaceae archaeon H-GB1-1]MEA5407431.1 glutamyl-tRNA reductase [Haloarculaceae archaeon H-GB2-1]